MCGKSTVGEGVNVDERAEELGSHQLGYWVCEKPSWSL